MNKNDIPDSVVESLARGLLPLIRDFFNSPEGQAEYEKWLADKELKSAGKDKTRQES